jgi:hypothetical protein
MAGCALRRRFVVFSFMTQLLLSRGIPTSW